MKPAWLISAVLLAVPSVARAQDPQVEDMVPPLEERSEPDPRIEQLGRTLNQVRDSTVTQQMLLEQNAQALETMAARQDARDRSAAAQKETQRLDGQRLEVTMQWVARAEQLLQVGSTDAADAIAEAADALAAMEGQPTEMGLARRSLAIASTAYDDRNLVVVQAQLENAQQQLWQAKANLNP